MTDLEKHLNDGTRPSRLEISRLHAGEIRGEEAERLRERIAQHPEARAWLRDLESPSGAPPFDAEILRSRAWRIREDEAASPPRPAAHPRRWRRVWAGLAVVAAAALALVAILPQPEPTHRTKGVGELDFYVLRDGDVLPGSEDEVHMPGDRIQFTYRSAGPETLVLLSVDGRGEINVFYPHRGDEPVAVVPGERRVLPGSIELDDAPEYELFLGWFGASRVGDVLDTTERILDREGIDGLLRLAEEDPDIVSLVVPKPPSSESERR